jgi:hypothetical protein
MGAICSKRVLYFSSVQFAARTTSYHIHRCLGEV